VRQAYLAQLATLDNKGPRDCPDLVDTRAVLDFPEPLALRALSDYWGTLVVWDLLERRDSKVAPDWLGPTVLLGYRDPGAWREYLDQQVRQVRKVQSGSLELQAVLDPRARLVYGVPMDFKDSRVRSGFILRSLIFSRA